MAVAETRDFEWAMQTYRSRIFRYALASPLRDRDAAEIVTLDSACDWIPDDAVSREQRAAA